MANGSKSLFLTFHGRVLEHLGIQIYQSPVNSIAEMVSNAWDADAEAVDITLPVNVDTGSELVICDNGIGMTFNECQQRFLNVGWNRRRNDPNEKSPGKKRPILGRKGIGKFAGFGIAERIQIETVSIVTGERTVFYLDLPQLLSEDYVSTERKTVTVLEYEEPNPARISKHGTKVTLSTLKLKLTPNPAQFAKSMARRFILHQRQADFTVKVNARDLPDGLDLSGVQFSYPQDYRSGEGPTNISIDDDGWGIETIEHGNKILWRFMFHKETIDEEELRGIAVYANGKIAQAPFLFNLTGGLGGQHGVEYLAGQLQADYLDVMDEDLIATERQRINWDHEATLPLLEWGKSRVKGLLKLWQLRRSEGRLDELEMKVSEFGDRIRTLPTHESKVIRNALLKLAQIPTLSDKQYSELGDAILTAWEQGRIRELINSIAETDQMSEGELLSILIEAQIVTALNVAEAVRTKLLAIAGLKDRIDKQELELAVRNYIAEHPWMISPQWETYRREHRVAALVTSIAEKTGLTAPDYKGRVDLVLSSGSHLLVLEFMRPGLKLDWDHLSRFERYITLIRSGVHANTAGQFDTVSGFVIADQLDNLPEIVSKIKAMRREDMFAMDWQNLLSEALNAWREYLITLAGRAPEDSRLQSLLN